MLLIVSAGMPGPLSVTMISPVSVDTVIANSGATPISSAMSRPLSASQLFDDDERPLCHLVAGLRDQLLYAAKLEQPRRLERLSVEGINPRHVTPRCLCA